MKAYLGKCFSAHRKNHDVNVVWDSDELQNGHTLFIGRPGTGKTHQMRRFITALQRGNASARVHIFDVHDDLTVDGASSVVFSQSTPFGLNPLVVGPDPHFGGVNKCINAFLNIINRVSGNLGPRQQSLMRNLLLDVYRARGFDPERSETWLVDAGQAQYLGDGTNGRCYLNIPFDEKDDAKGVANIHWDRNMKAPGFEAGCWWISTKEYEGAITRWPLAIVGRMHPTLDDVIAYAKRQRSVAFMGSDQQAVHAFEAYRRAARSYLKAEQLAIRSGGNKPDGLEDSRSAKEKAAGKAMDAYAHFLEQMRSGDELEEQIKYDKVENLNSIIDRLETLRASGVFKNQPPPFDPDAAVWRYRLRALEREEKRLLVLFRLRELYNQAVERGAVKGLRDIIVVDEAHLYADEDGEDILSVLAREARKFGVAIVAANQTAGLPKDFIASLGTKVVLGLADEYMSQAVSKMGMTLELLKWITPKVYMAVQMHDSSPASGQWRGVMLNAPEPVQSARRQTENAQG